MFLERLASMQHNSILLLGVGHAGKAVAKAINEIDPRRKIYGTTRDQQKITVLEDLGIEPIAIHAYPTGDDLKRILACADNNLVVASFPPKGDADKLFCQACVGAKAIVYISTTSVYGKRTGMIDHLTPVDESDENAKERLKAEAIWQQVGAIVIRAPGIYGPSSGLHLRLKRGNYNLPGDGLRYVSRIHVDDLAAIIIAALAKARRGSTYVVGDLEPTTHLQAVQWLCEKMNLPLPSSVSLDAVSPTLRGNRQVSSMHTLKELDVTLKYPTYREGFLQCLQSAEFALTV
jgi:hypothetical protein